MVCFKLKFVTENELLSWDPCDLCSQRKLAQLGWTSAFCFVFLCFMAQVSLGQVSKNSTTACTCWCNCSLGVGGHMALTCGFSLKNPVCWAWCHDTLVHLPGPAGCAASCLYSACHIQLACGSSRDTLSLGSPMGCALQRGQAPWLLVPVSSFSSQDSPRDGGVVMLPLAGSTPSAKRHALLDVGLSSSRLGRGQNPLFHGLGDCC